LVEAAPLLDRPQALGQPPALNATAAEPDAAALPALLDSVAYGRKAVIWQQFDHTVQAATVAHAEQAAAAVVRVPETGARLALCTAGEERFAALDPWLGGAAAVAAVTRQLACSGAVPLGLTDCLNAGSPEDPAVMAGLVATMRGIGDAAEALRCPVVSGNVSLYNSTGAVAVLPTPMLAAIGRIPDGVAVCPSGFGGAGDAIWLVGDWRPTRGGAGAWSDEHASPSGPPPALHLATEAGLQAWLAAAHRGAWLRSARPIGTGGLALALALGCLSGHGGGCDCTLPASPGPTTTATSLFGACTSCVLVTAAADHDLAAVAPALGVAVQRIGAVTAIPSLRAGPWQWSIAALQVAWEQGLARRLYPDDLRSVS
jgi:phosphoribosylformylglycinamidine synthase